MESFYPNRFVANGQYHEGKCNLAGARRPSAKASAKNAAGGFAMRTSRLFGMEERRFVMSKILISEARFARLRPYGAQGHLKESVFYTASIDVYDKQ